MNINYIFAPKINELEEVFFFEPEPIIDYLATSRKGNQILKCPAFLDYYKNTYLIKAPMDLTLNISGSQVTCQQSYPADYLNLLIMNRTEERSKISMLQILWNYTFYSNDSVMVEVLPPTWHKNSFQNNINVLGATFDISKWARPLNFAFEIIDDTKPIVIKRGDPLYYVRFNTLNKVKLVKQEPTKEIENLIMMCVNVKSYSSNNSMQKNYSLMKRIIDKLKPKSCPFRWKN
jgi:hypothetical protein